MRTRFADPLDREAEDLKAYVRAKRGLASYGMASVVVHPKVSILDPRDEISWKDRVAAARASAMLAVGRSPASRNVEIRQSRAPMIVNAKADVAFDPVVARMVSNAMHLRYGREIGDLNDRNVRAIRAKSQR
ncbi:MAG: hypothetical protein ABSF67_04395 [Roseiarcus sp.]|jgi:hypothetical protein